MNKFSKLETNTLNSMCLTLGHIFLPKKKKNFGIYLK